MIDLDDLLDGIGPSGELGSRGQRVVRVLFGLFLALLCGAGAWQVVTTDDGGVPLRIAYAAMLGCLGLLGLVTIAVGRAGKQLGCLFVVSFAAMFVVRLLFGP